MRMKTTMKQVLFCAVCSRYLPYYGSVPEASFLRSHLPLSVAPALVSPPACLSTDTRVHLTSASLLSLRSQQPLYFTPTLPLNSFVCTCTTLCFLASFLISIQSNYCLVSHLVRPYHQLSPPTYHLAVHQPCRIQTSATSCTLADTGRLGQSVPTSTPFTQLSVTLLTMIQVCWQVMSSKEVLASHGSTTAFAERAPDAGTNTVTLESLVCTKGV